MGKKDSNKDTSVVFLYDESSAALQTALKGIKPAGAKVFGLDNDEIEADSRKKEKVEEKIKDLKISNAKSCSVCGGICFETSEEQREHFKLDWHRYNLKQSLLSKPPVSEDKFEKLVEENDDLDNISLSGSDTENEDEDDDNKVSTPTADQQDNDEMKRIRHPKVFFENESGHLYSIHGCLLLSTSKREESSTEEEEVDNSDAQLVSRIPGLKSELKWAIFMLGGGHFAGAVFHGKKAVVHKTFHCYTVRAKQGGSQGSADNKSGGSHPKSAGASLRRYNEQSLIQHVQNLVSSWTKELAAADLIFYRAVSGNRTVLFGGKEPPLNRNDPRLRSIPFPTRRATFTEVQRVHQLLSTINCLGSVESYLEDAAGSLEKQQSNRENRAAKKKKKNKNIRRSKSREEKERRLPSEVRDILDGESSSSGDEPEFVFATAEVDLSHLKEFDNSPVPKPKSPKKNTADNQQLQVITACKTGNAKQLQNCLDQADRGDGGEDGSVKLINERFGSTMQTPLHLATTAGHKNIIKILLESGADPSRTDKSKKVPYNLCQNKEVRNVYRNFIRTNPDKYDYKAAQIPPPLSEEEEQNQKEKLKAKNAAKKAARKEKEKAAKEVEREKKREGEEKQRYLNLSDREKRALAAERRILAAKAETGGEKPVLVRCFQCGADMSGKVPFEYEIYKFCAVNCLKNHRKKMTGA